MTEKLTWQDRVVASMVLGAVGDTVGFNGGSWEFCHSGPAIVEELDSVYGGIQALDIQGWRYSDDTVQHIATAQALLSHGMPVLRAIQAAGDVCFTSIREFRELCESIGWHYVSSWSEMGGRAAGSICAQGVSHMAKGGKWDEIPYYRGPVSGCGACMRCKCVGLAFPQPGLQRKLLVAVAVETARLSHNHIGGILGAVTVAFFTALAANQGTPVSLWPALLLSEALPLTKQYLKASGRRSCPKDQAHIEHGFRFFEQLWTEYIALRGLGSASYEAEVTPVFPPQYGPKERDLAYKRLFGLPCANREFPGQRWHGWDSWSAPLIAYDALLGSGGSWMEVLLRGALHGGDGDSTGIIAGCWFGARHGLEGVPPGHLNVENKELLVQLGIDLAKLSKD